jgi:hypothetical protein
MAGPLLGWLLAAGRIWVFLFSFLFSFSNATQTI